MKKVLIVDHVDSIFFDQLKNEQVILDYRPDISPVEVEEIISEYHGLVTNSKLRLGQGFFEKAKQLEFAVRAGSGMDIFDLDAAENSGVKCYNTPEGNKDAVAEHTLGMLLSLVNNINRSDLEIRNGVWQREANRGREISEMTIGIIGYGNNGSAFARRLAALGAKVIAYDKYKTGFSEKGIEEVELKSIFQQADALSLHVPLTKETKFWLDYRFWERFDRKIYFINCSRGKIVLLSDLLKALRKGFVLGAALDVFEKEPLHNLLEHQKGVVDGLLKEHVIFTPHIAGWTHESKRKIGELLANKILGHL